MAQRTQTPKLAITKKYSIFTGTVLNRPLHLGKRKKLRASMKEYGFLPAYPLNCKRQDGRLVLVDGQHRLAAAKELGLPVFYVVDQSDINIAQINATQKSWKMSEYADCYAGQGFADYIELIAFAKKNSMAYSLAAAILADKVQAGTSILVKFRDGHFRITNRATADRIAGLLNRIAAYCPAVKTRHMICALFSCCKVENFSDKRILKGVARSPETLMKYGSRDGYLDMLERIYNIGYHTKYPLKIAAENAMKERNPATREEK